MRAQDMAGLLFVFIIIGAIGVFASLNGWNGTAFFLFSIILMTLGRRLGWGMTKITVFSPVSLFIVTGIIWGILVAACFRLLIGWQDPNLILRIVMGYGAGTYTSIPNYGLWENGNGPNTNQDTIFSTVPFFTFVLASIAFAFI